MFAYELGKTAALSPVPGAMPPGTTGQFKPGLFNQMPMKRTLPEKPAAKKTGPSKFDAFMRPQET